MSDVIISLVEVIENKFCTASDDGEKVHIKIAEALGRGDRVQISFQGVEDLTSAFLNAAVGQLYGEFPEDKLRSVLLPPLEASPEDLALLKRVVDRAKAFFQDPERFKRAAREESGNAS